MNSRNKTYVNSKIQEYNTYRNGEGKVHLLGFYAVRNIGAELMVANHTIDTLKRWLNLLKTIIARDKETLSQETQKMIRLRLKFNNARRSQNQRQRLETPGFQLSYNMVRRSVLAYRKERDALDQLYARIERLYKRQMMNKNKQKRAAVGVFEEGPKYPIPNLPIHLRQRILREAGIDTKNKNYRRQPFWPRFFAKARKTAK